MWTSSAYNRVMVFVGGALSCVGTRIFSRPRQTLMLLYCQFYLMFAECNHGRPSSKGYAPGASRANTTSDISNVCSPITIFNLRSSPNGRMDLVSTMRSQNGHASQSVRPNRLEVALLMKLTLEPPSMMHPYISCSCSITLIAELWWLTTVGPVVDSAKFAEMVT